MTPCWSSLCSSIVNAGHMAREHRALYLRGARRHVIPHGGETDFVPFASRPLP